MKNAKKNILEIYNFDDDDTPQNHQPYNAGAGLVINPNNQPIIKDVLETKQDPIDETIREEPALSMKKIKRVKQPKWIYFLTLICTLLTGVENIYIFLTRTT